jgi:hypothetical protein
MRLIPLLISCLLMPNLFSQELPQPASPSPQTPAVEREEKQFSFFPGGKLEITAGVPGSLKIIGWQKASVQMEAVKIFHSSPTPAATAAPAKSPIRVRYGQTSAVITTSAGAASDMEINLTVYVPSDKTDIKANVNRGDFSIEGVNGWVETTIATDGNLTAKSLSGYFSGTTPRGDLNVEMSGIRWRGLQFAAVTHSGSIVLSLPVKFSAALQLETRDGKISVDYPPQVVEGEEQPPDIVIHKNSQKLKAAVGDGGAPIILTTHSGDVSLAKKE